MFRIDPDDPRPLYVQLVDEVRTGVLRGTLAPDSPLPSVREVAGRMRLNPNTVQQAYRELEREGLVYVRRGLGTFVVPEPPRPALRDAAVRELAERCLREAARAGLTADELVTGIREAATGRDPDHPTTPERRTSDAAQ